MIKLGLVGEKLSHSISPKIHEEIMRDKGITGTYEIIELPMETFSQGFTVIKNAGFRGINITIPYKEIVIPLLDEISPKAKYIGAVNTVLFQDGKSIGYNTDYHGFLLLLKKNNIEIKGKEAIVLGSGGVAKAVVKALLDNGVYDITIVSRGKQNFHGTYTISYEYFREAKLKSDILINCTPVGMYPNVGASPIPKEFINSNIVIDTIYNPEKTQLLKYAEELGLKTINGSIMLYEQAVKAQEIWTY